jgi:hypothetical protein
MNSVLKIGFIGLTLIWASACKRAAIPIHGCSNQMVLVDSLQGYWDLNSIHDSYSNLDQIFQTLPYSHYFKIQNDTIFYYNGDPRFYNLELNVKSSAFCLNSNKAILFQNGPGWNYPEDSVKGFPLAINFDNRYSQFFPLVRSYKIIGDTLILFQSNQAYFMKFFQN